MVPCSSSYPGFTVHIWNLQRNPNNRRYATIQLDSNQLTSFRGKLAKSRKLPSIGLQAYMSYTHLPYILPLHQAAEVKLKQPFKFVASEYQKFKIGLLLGGSLALFLESLALFLCFSYTIELLLNLFAAKVLFARPCLCCKSTH